ncbi:MAG TPA: acyltransferase [Solirubrobacteraceae bacterium]|nr:acyltransferase [Solirubrobacteraceae bacterium]
MTARTLKVRRDEFPLLDSVRGIAAMLVFTIHVSYYVRMDGVLGHYLSQRFEGFPPTAVAVFFALSGFLLYRPFARARLRGRPLPSIRAYAVRRVARIVPAYWLTLVLIALWVDRGYVFSASNLGTYFGFTQLYNVHTYQGGLAQAWTIDVEMTFYVLLPLLAIALNRLRASSTRSFLRSELTFFGLLVLLCIGWQVFAVETVSPTSPHVYAAVLSLPGSLDFFVVGMALASLSVAAESAPSSRAVALIKRAPWLAWAGALVGCVALVHSRDLFGSNRTVAWVCSHELRSVVTALLLLPAIFGSVEQGVLRRLLGLGALRWVGKVSFGLYLWHVVLLEKFRSAGLIDSLGPVGYVLVAFAASLAMGALSWYAIERPALALAARLPRSGRHEPPGQVGAPAPATAATRRG